MLTTEPSSHRHGNGSRSREVYGKRSDCKECQRIDANLKNRVVQMSGADRERFARMQANIPQNQRQHTGVSR